MYYDVKAVYLLNDDLAKRHFIRRVMLGFQLKELRAVAVKYVMFVLASGSKYQFVSKLWEHFEYTLFDDIGDIDAVRPARRESIQPLIQQPIQRPIQRPNQQPFQPYPYNPTPIRMYVPQPIQPPMYANNEDFFNQQLITATTQVEFDRMLMVYFHSHTRAEFDQMITEWNARAPPTIQQEIIENENLFNQIITDTRDEFDRIIAQLTTLANNVPPLEKKYNVCITLDESLSLNTVSTECAICYEDITCNGLKINCNHVFCGDCIQKTLVSCNTLSPLCALCREPMKTFQVQNKDTFEAVKKNCISSTNINEIVL
jgi:hypothetical protein